MDLQYTSQRRYRTYNIGGLSAGGEDDKEEFLVISLRKITFSSVLVLFSLLKYSEKVRLTAGVQEPIYPTIV